MPVEPYDHEYLDVRDLWQTRKSGEPIGWLNLWDKYSFKSDPFGDRKPTFGEYYDRKRGGTVYYVEELSIGHMARVEARSLLELEHKWNDRAYQNTYFKEHPQYKVCPFKAIVNEVPVRTGNSHPESAARIFRGHHETVIPKYKYLYVDGDKNGGYNLAAWSKKVIHGRTESTGIFD